MSLVFNNTYHCEQLFSIKKPNQEAGCVLLINSWRDACIWQLQFNLILTDYSSSLCNFHSHGSTFVQKSPAVSVHSCVSSIFCQDCPLLSVYVCGLPLGIFPVIFISFNFFGILCSSILFTCLNHLKYWWIMQAKAVSNISLVTDLFKRIYWVICAPVHK
jgi:hypothetical protein